jgi:Cu-processing system permease protein
MLSPILVVAKNTHLEMIRDRVLYFVVIFTILFTALCFALGQLSYNEIFRLSVSLGLAGIHLCYAGLTIFLGCSVFYREIEHKTIYTLLIRPITRSEYLLGKYIGLLSLLFTMLVGFMLCFTLIEWLLGMPVLMTSYYSFFGFFLESMILLAVTFLFSSFAKPFLSITGTLCFWLIGHWVHNLSIFIEKSSSISFVIVARTIQRFFPDLEALNWRQNAIAKHAVSSDELLWATVAAVLWALFIFSVSLLIFRNRDFD